MSISKNYIMAGMLASALVVPLSDVTDSHASEIRVTTARVHFRTGAGTNYSSMGVLDEGTKVTYISASGNWTKVQYNSKTGYICSDYLEKEQSTSTTSTMYVINFNNKHYVCNTRCWTKRKKRSRYKLFKNNKIIKRDSSNCTFNK